VGLLEAAVDFKVNAETIKYSVLIIEINWTEFSFISISETHLN